MPFVNGLLKKKGLQQLVQYCYLHFGLEKTVEMLDSLKNLGFTYATRSGLSIGIDDLIIPKEKAALVERARDEVIKVEGQYLEGAITNGERYNKVIADLVGSHREDRQRDVRRDGGARQGRAATSTRSTSWPTPARAARKQQIRQLAGMRGLMAKPSGEIIETPITSNFREGLDGAAVLHLDARRAQGSGRHGAQDGRLGLPDAPSRRRGAGRHHPRDRLRHGGRHRGAGDRRIGRDHRAAARPHHRPRHARADRRSVHRATSSSTSTTRSTKRWRRRSRTPASRR